MSHHRLSVGGRLRLSSVLLGLRRGGRGHRGRRLLRAQSPAETLAELLDGDLQKEGHEPRSGKNDKMIHRCLHVDPECACAVLYYVTYAVLCYVTCAALCYIMSRVLYYVTCAVLCYITLCYLCCTMLSSVCCTILSYITLRVLYYVTVHYAFLCYVTLRYVTECYVSLRYAMLCYIALCYVTCYLSLVSYFFLKIRNECDTAACFN